MKPTWSRCFPTIEGSASASSSRLALGDVEQLREFAPGLEPVQVDDEGTTLAEMGRGALRVRVTYAAGKDVDLVSCHLKS